MQDAGSLEKLLLAVLLLASTGLFWLRFGKVARAILGSRPDPGFQLRPLLPRLRSAAWEVLLQAKVIRHRPLPGLAHALVFWGFCAFALVTLDHLASGFGLPLLDRHSGLGRIHAWIAASMAVAVAASIAGLALRRFLLRPRWLGDLSPESGLIAFLISLLMVSYLAEFVVGTRGWLWWTHTLALLVFLPLIPHTKHLHLLLSPLTVFLARGGFGRIPPLEGDDDFGFTAGRDLTRLTALEAYTCVECGRCTEHCPAYNTGKELNPKQIILGVRDYLNENGARAEAPLLGRHITQEAVFQCTTCGACEYQCPVGVQHLPLITGLRRGAVNTGQWEDEHGTRLFLNLERYGNPLGAAPAERDRFIAANHLPYYDGTQEYCLWLGCMGSYDPRARQTVLDLARLLGYLGVSFGVLRKEKCSGDAARRLGNDLVFAELASFNLEQIEAAGVKKLLSICPHCVRTISEDWREAGAAPPIEHHSEFLARHARRLPPPSAGSSRVVFHDACYLGRYRGVYDAPRALASRAGTLVEAGLARERTFCCGAGGGLVFLGEEKGTRVGVERARQLTQTGANVAAAACPFCATMLGDALAASPAGAPQLVDIARIAAAGLPDGRI